MDCNSAVTVNRRSSRAERQFALAQIYQQVLERQPYESERAGELAHLERDFLKNKIGVRRFLKELGTSELYLNAFYYRSSNPKFVETCLKHFLGRAIASSQEMKTYIDALTQGGVNTLIIGIMDSEEYRKAFGCFTVPYPRKLSCYESPKVYFENNAIAHEHYGQRGQALPIMYWHQLGLDCETGVCRHPEVTEALVSRSSEATETSPDSLLNFMQAFESSQTITLPPTPPRQRQKRAIKVSG